MGKRIFHSFTFQILLIIVCSIIPINILTVYLSTTLVYRYENRILDSYYNELALYMTKIDGELQSMQDSMNEMVQKHWIELSMGEKSKDTSIERLAFWEALQNSRKNIDIVTAAYLRTNWENSAYLTADSEKCSLDERKRLQEYLTDAVFSDEKAGVVFVRKIDDTFYLIKNYNCLTYSFGYVIGLDGLLEPLKEIASFDNEKILLCDADGRLIGEEQTLDRSKESQEMIFDGRSRKVLTVVYPSEQMSYCLIRLLDQRDLYLSVPVLERTIQILGLLSLLVLPIVWYQIRKMVIRPLKNLDHAMHEIENENLDYRLEEELSSIELAHINQAFNHMAGRISSLTIESYEKELERLESEAINLRLQINPHMLLNSLNMIYSLAQSQNYKCIRDYTMHLVQYFRYALRRTDDFVSLREEMDFVNNYLEIQKIRFPNSFTYTYDIDEELYSAALPPLMIENFVENSIKYALKLGEEIEIILIIKKIEGFMEISVVDTGNGMPEETLDKLNRGELVEDRIGRHVGIWNCKRRLKLYYGDNAELNICSRLQEGTQVHMRIPFS